MKKTARRAAIVVLDGVGVGAAADAAAYGDAGSNTLGNLARAVGGLELPNFQRLGLGGVVTLQGMPPAAAPSGAFGLMEPSSAGKDSTTGHWEIAGLKLAVPFPTYPSGFPQSVLDEFAARTGREVICNEVASGTTVLERWAETHLRTGAWIVYTSADSVFQVAAHESVVPLAELYSACEKAREKLVAPNDVSRVIARPFTGEPAPGSARPIAAIFRSPRLARRCWTPSPRPGSRARASARSTTSLPAAASMAAIRREIRRGIQQILDWIASEVGSCSATL